MQEMIVVNRPVSSSDGLGEHLSAEYVFGFVILTPIEIPLDRFNIEDVDDFLQNWVHAR